MSFPRAVPLALFLLITMVTVLSVFAIERGEDERAAGQVRNRTLAVGAALERRINSSNAYLRAGAALLATLEDIPATRFRRFVSELRLDADYRGTEGIGWAMVVYPDQVGEFDRMMETAAPGRVRMFPRPDGSQSFSVPVTFLQPDTERNRRSLGYDMYSEPVRRAAMQEAERTARPTASGKVTLTQDGPNGSPGFLIYMPVFESTPTGRRLRGFIYSPFNAQDFLNTVLAGDEIEEVNVSLYDGPVSKNTLLAEVVTSDRPAADSIRERVSIANSPWTLEVTAAGVGGLSSLSMVTVIFGLLVATLSMLLVRALTQQAIEDDTTLKLLEEQASIRNSLTRELNHRVKNTLANVLSIIALTRRRARTLDDFADGLDGRIRALSATHDLLTQSDWGATPIASVVGAELLPYAQASDHETDLQGPDIELAPNDALSLGLAVHELATNAAKYGALSRAGGKVTVHWKMVSDTLVRIEWRESGGPPVPPQRGRGFGTDLIERIVAHELKNPVDLVFEPTGVRCVLTIPVRRRDAFALRGNRPANAAPATGAQSTVGAA